MKKILVTTMLLALIGSCNAVMADTNVAIVDIQAVIAKSAQVQALNKEQQAKIADLNSWLKTVKEDVEKQKTKEDKEKLVKKYDAEFVKKQEAIRDNYNKKLQTIDKSITDTITNEAKAKGYNLVIPKGVVIYGGTDITKDVMKVVK